MGMTLALSIASTEIGNINAQLGVVSQNVANASTPDYAQETISQITVNAGGIGMGAVNTPVSRAINTQLQTEVFAQNGDIAALQTQQTALQQIDSVAGPVGSSSDIGSLLGNVQSAFSTLETNPADPVQQQAVVGAASALTSQINSVSDAVQANRQTAQNAIVSQVGQLNTTLATIGTLSDQIIQAQAVGQSTADLQNQRDAAVDTLSHLISIKTIAQPNGDLLITTASGLTLPIHDDPNPFSTSGATLGATVYAPGGGVPPITFDGQDVTSQLTGGEIGGNIALRDQILPTYQANLDEFSYTLSSRFAAQGLTLFTDPTGNVPTSTAPPAQAGYIGYAGTIQVNPAVTQDPALVRDGTNAVAGSATGAAAFTPNPPGGPAGFTTLITNILDYALGDEAQAGVPQPPPAVSGLGPTGTLSAGFVAPENLAAQATATSGAQAQQSAAVTAQLTTEQAVQASVQTQLAAGSAVSIDAQMSNMVVLQNSYGANARVIAAVQAMWAQLLSTVQ
jgi:flagellar hook-associated protein 1 FlgK